MLLRVVLLVIILNFAKSTENVYNQAEYNLLDPDNVNFNQLYVNKEENLHIFRKREAVLAAQQANENTQVVVENGNKHDSDNVQKQEESKTPNDEAQSSNSNNPHIQNSLPIGQSEGGLVGEDSVPAKPKENETVNKSQISDITVAPAKETPKTTNETVTQPAITKLNDTSVKTNATTAEIENLVPINSPGVVKRGLIVFGGFALLAVAYFIFYRKKGKKYDANSTHNNSDTNQFRYGVLQSEDRRDNLELSRIPLTMESDEDEDEDLEIFDLEQKRKSLSYVNLQTNDEDIVLHSSKDESKNNLLLDIEDGPSDTLINWSSNGNKSIL